MPNPTHLVFMAKRQVGFQLLPTDGSPFNNIGMNCHPTKLGDCCISNDGKYLFSFGEGERSLIMRRTCPE